MSSGGPPADRPDAAEFGNYVASFCKDFAEMAASARYPVLAYLLTLTQTEAERVQRGAVLPE